MAKAGEVGRGSMEAYGAALLGGAAFERRRSAADSAHALPPSQRARAGRCDVRMRSRRSIGTAVSTGRGGAVAKPE